jgi:hypothetical protein
MDLGRILRERLRQAFESGPAPEEDAPTNGSPARPVADPGQVTSVYCDSRVTIIHRTGENPVIRLDDQLAGERFRSPRSAAVVAKGQESQR